MIKVDVRVIAGTQVALGWSVENGHFLEDLYLELSGSQIILPPLRERREDIPLLAQHFFLKHGKETGKELKSNYQNLIENFDSYDWSENVRDLEKIIRETVAASYN